MESFAGYSFCKAHSASYAVLSFQEAYLKAHYPALFLCSVLNNQGGYYRPDVYIQEAKRLGIGILLPSVNASEEKRMCVREPFFRVNQTKPAGEISQARSPGTRFPNSSGNSPVTS